MNHLGEVISLGVAVSWTVTAWFADKASRRVGAMVTNVLRLVLAALFLGILLWVTIGHPYPVYADKDAWLWLGLSALVGYVFGDYCLFNCYLYIGPRFGQLMMTLAPPMAAIAGWMMLGLQKDFGKLHRAVKDPVAMKYASIITLFGPAIGVSLSLMAVRYAHAGIASTLMALTPVLIIIPDVLINKKKIRFKEIIGLAVSITGVALFFLL
jgi:drug/metabolite transporter (DMT)-like permease